MHLEKQRYTQKESDFEILFFFLASFPFSLIQCLLIIGAVIENLKFRFHKFFIPTAMAFIVFSTTVFSLIWVFLTFFSCHFWCQEVHMYKITYLFPGLRELKLGLVFIYCLRLLWIDQILTGMNSNFGSNYSVMIRT